MIRAFALAVVFSAASLMADASLANERSVVSVTVDTRTTLATIQHGAVGLDIWFPNSRAAEPQALARYREAGLQALGYDGGPAVDLFDWRTNTLKPWPDPRRAGANYGTTHGRVGTFEEVLQPRVSFEQFCELNRTLGTVGRAHVNYGTGTAEEAGAWVQWARQRTCNVRYWDIGQYQSGNGILGPDIDHYNEPDGHPDKSAAGYARKALQFIELMKAADAGIKVGVHLHWDTRSGSPGRAWNEEVLSIAGRAIDFIDIWGYFPRGNDDAAALRSTSTLPAWIAAYRELLDRYGARDRQQEIIVGETALDVAGAPRNISLTAALFLPDQILTLLQSGVSRVDWFNSHLGQVPRFWYGGTWLQRNLRGTPAMMQPADTQFGDYGLLSSGDCDFHTNICQPPAHTPYAPFYGLKMLRYLAEAGSVFVGATSSDEDLRVHAVKRADGSAAVLLINRSDTQLKSAKISVSGYKTGEALWVISYGKGSADLSCRRADVVSLDRMPLPAYSLTTVVLGGPSRVQGCT